MEDNRTEQKSIAIGQGEFVRSPDFRSIYANQIQVGMSPFDFQLTLSQGSAAGGVARNEIQAVVFLSPQETKVLASILSRIVGDFERQFGTISVPQGLLGPAPDESASKVK